MSGRLATRRVARALCCAVALRAGAWPARADEPAPSTLPLAAAIERAVADDPQLRAARAELEARRLRAAAEGAEAANAADARRRGIGPWLRGRPQRGAAGEGGAPTADASALEVAERAVERARMFALERAVGAVLDQERQAQRVAESRRPVEAAASADASVLADALARWADAWRGKDVGRYVASYAQDYAPAGTTRDRWLAQRIERLAQPGSFEITIESPRWNQTGAELAEVRFTQRYRAARYADVVDKQIVWRRGPDGWRIVAELTRNEAVVRGTPPRAVQRRAENG